jgi:DNA-binding transcriptional ArsR family regulator
VQVRFLTRSFVQCQSAVVTERVVRLVEEPERLRVALSPLRRRLLELLRVPTSATELAATLGLARQKVNYHVRALESAGLVRLVEERQRRGFTERVLQATADAYVVDPGVMGTADESPVLARDRFAAEHLVSTAARTVRDVSRMRQAAADRGTRLLTFTVEAEVRFAQPADVHRFADTVATAIAAAAAEVAAPDGAGRAYRIVVGAHPAPAQPHHHHDPSARPGESP